MQGPYDTAQKRLASVRIRTAMNSGVIGERPASLDNRWNSQAAHRL